MSKTPEPEHITPIPEELQKQLADFQRHLWRIKITEAILAGIFGLIVSFLLVFLVERFFPLPTMVRFGILIAGTSLCAIFAPLWVRRWVYGHRREEQLARLIAQKFPKLGDRLLGIVELQDQDEARESLSPELRAAAMAHVAAQAGKRDMTEAMPASRHRKLALGVGMGVAAITAGFIVAPKAGSNALKRWLMPFSETEHYTFTQFDESQIPNPLTVPYGEAFTIKFPLKEDSDQKPVTAKARYGEQDWLESPLGENSYAFDFPGQQHQNFINLQAGDATLRIRVEPEIRPDLTDLKAKVELPPYLQLDPREIDIRTGTLTSLEGSKVTLTGTFSRELAKAQAVFIPESPDPEPSEVPEALDGVQDIPKTEPLPEPRALAFTIDGPSLKSETFELANHPASIPMTWTDVKGLDGASTFTVKVHTAEDGEPVCYMQGVERQIVILAEETLEFEVIAEDDFGLKEVGLAWKGQFTTPTDKKPANGDMILKKGSPSMARLSEQAIFSPQTYDIAPQKLILSAYSEDYKPERGRIYSEPVVIYILTRDEHAQLLKTRFDRIIRELEDAARREQNNLDANERLDQLNKPEQLQKEEAQRKLSKSQDAEDQNAEKMDEISKKMEELFKDAVRNGDVDKETMKKMADALQNMKELAQKDLPEVEKKLGEAQDQKSTAEKAKKDLKEAIEKQKEALKKMQDTVKMANEANQNFEASTFVNRLKRAASDEDGIASALNSALCGNDSKDVEIPLVGSVPEAIDPVHTRLLKSLDLQQKRTTGDIRWIQEDLGRFHARTQKPIHKEIFEDMRKSLIDVKLESLRLKIGKNHTFISISMAKKWADVLREWAKKLDGEKNSGGGGGDGGGGGEEKDFEFMLKVMRMVQAEQDIRARTRSLEQMLRSLKLRKTPSN